MSRFGIDFAWHSPITDAKARALRDKHGVSFVCRYYSNNSDTKNLTKAEAQVYIRNGIDILVVWESTATRASEGKAAGVTDAKKALAMAKACGQPASAPIFFAVDQDTTASRVAPYFQGVASVIGVGRTGVYAGINVVRGLLDAKLVTWAWQTYAWSAGKIERRTHLHQYSNGHTLEGISCDFNHALKPAFGQWSTKAPSKPTQKPSRRAVKLGDHDNAGNHDVAWLQTFLGRHGYRRPDGQELEVTGIFDAATDWTLRDAKARNAIRSTGKDGGTATMTIWGILKAKPTPRPVLDVGSEGDSVELLCKLLRYEARSDTLPISRTYSVRTVGRFVQDFRKRHGLSKSYKVDTAMWRLLGPGG